MALRLRYVFLLLYVTFSDVLVQVRAPGSVEPVYVACTVLSSTSASITFQWNPLEVAVTYRLQDQDDAANTATTATTTVTIGNLQAATCYYFALYVIDSNDAAVTGTLCAGSTGSSTSQCRQVASSTVDAVTYQWPSVSTATSFASDVGTVDTTATFTDSGATVKRFYSWCGRMTITAYDNIDNVVAGTPFDCYGATDTSTCIVQSATSHTITFQWRPAASAVRYSLNDQDTGDVLYDTNSPSYTVTDLPPASLSGFDLIGYDGSDARISMPSCGGQTAPYMTTSCTVQSLTSDSITFQWSPVDSATKYSLENNADGSIVSSVQLTNTSTITGLSAGTYYSFSLVAYNNVGFRSDNSVTCSATTAPHISTGNECSLQSSTDSSLTFQWSEVQSATMYLLYNQRGKLKVSSTSTNATITGLSPGSTHWYSLRASNGMPSDNSIVCFGTTVKRYYMCKNRDFRRKYRSWCVAHLCRQARTFVRNRIKRMRCLKYYYRHN